MWRRFVLLLILMLWALLLRWNASSLPPVNVKGIVGAGAAIQFVHSQQDLAQVLSPDPVQRQAMQSTLLREQFLDVVFIGLYWWFFFSLAAPIYRRGSWRIAGWLIRACISVAAVADLIEDFGIVSLIGPWRLPQVWPVHLAVVKWVLIFVALALVALYLAVCRPLLESRIQSRPVSVIAYFASFFCFASAFCGIVGIMGRFSVSGKLFPHGLEFMGLGLLLLLAIFWLIAYESRVSSGSRALNFKTILAEELEEIRRAEAARMAFDEKSSPSFPARGRDPLPRLPKATGPGSAIQQAGRSGLLGLAFSGGGIRSATFNLGVLQGLAELKLLRRFHYLSTVSGGGYIGSWLIAWIFRQGTKEVETRLAAPRTEQPNFKEPPEIRFLREYSNYLTPRKGVFGADTWTAIATYLRNLLLNQMVLISFIAAALLAPRVVVAGAQSARSLFQGTFSPIMDLLIAFAVLAAIGIARNMAYYNTLSPTDRVVARIVKGAPQGTSLKQLQVEWLLPEGESGERALGRIGRVEIWDRNIVRRRDIGHVTRLAGSDWGKRTLNVDVAIPNVEDGDLVVSVDSWTKRPAGIFSLVVLPIYLGISFLAWMLALAGAARSALWWPSAGAAIAFGSWLLGTAITRRQATGHSFLKMAMRAAACSAAGALGGILLRQTALLMHGWLDHPEGAWNVIGFGVPLVALVFLAFSIVQVGLLGTLLIDSGREWVGRLEAWLLIISVGWAGIFALAGFSPLFVLWLRQYKFSAWITALGWVATTLAGVLGGNSARTSGIDSTVKNKLLSLTPYVFALGLLVLVSAGVNQVMSGLPDSRKSGAGLDTLSVQMENAPADKVKIQMQAVMTREKSSIPVGDYWARFMKTPGPRVLIAFVLCLVGSLLLAMRVDLNEFSMHYFYRNRLVRCYLGASHRERVPHPFTGLDIGDDLYLASLTSDKGYDGPYPILGCALNLVHGKDLAWQERKAASFIMTPRYCGYDVWYEKLLRPGQSEKRGQATDGYRPTGEYAYPDGGFFVGTAMAISGAAASPNMGFHSSPALAFLMTVFNVRLGQWMGNPRDPRCWRRAAPRIGLGYLLSELFGAADDDSGYVYLSDGGHFENLGLYELVKRRCRLILAVDAGEDHKLAFDDLASAVRKCRADMGIDIEIRTEKLLAAGSTNFSRWHCAIGRIKYSNSDPPVKDLPPGPGNIVEDGWLVYIKPTLTGDEPADVLNYKNVHPEFPHESTVDEWFSESQFESYRALGQHVIRTLFYTDGSPQDLSRVAVDDLIQRLKREWKDPERIRVNREEHIHPAGVSRWGRR